uniref:GRIP domain-containing protein n=1 Tax=Ditylenchus dipsaci TaxID=166011 RepID=A0A915E9U7_9BILA
MEAKLRQVNKMEAEIQMLRKKAEATPTAQVLREELVNMKLVYEEELASIRNRHTMSSSVLNDKDSRIVHMENRVKELTEQGAAAEQQKVELENTIEELRRQLAFISTKHEKLKQSIVPSISVLKHDDNTDLVSLANQLKLAAQPLGIDLYELLLELTVDQSKELDPLRQPSPDASDVSNCDSCETFQKEVLYFKSLIGHLQKKLDCLEEGHEASKRNNEQMCETLRKRIIELEESQEKIYSQLTSECKNKVAELEEELQKQQLRMMDIAAEKDQEIEITKSSLAALYAKGYATSALDPLDPPQTSSSQRLDRRKTRLGSLQGRNSVEESVLMPGSSMDDIADLSQHAHPMSLKRTMSQFGEARNVFYEQELIKREQEIFELRNMVRLSEMKVRDIEQSMLTKDMQYLQIMETLKEEIRVLEGRLTLERSETNMAYLRNIFIQFINSNNSTGRKHILKAIGAVLRLTHIEMKKIDTWNL